MSDHSNLGNCPLCGRAMVAGPSVDRHHWVPKSKGGRVCEALHRVCHRKLHAVFSETELAREWNTPQKARTDPRIAAFVAWVQRKPPDYWDSHDRPKTSRRRR